MHRGPATGTASNAAGQGVDDSGGAAGSGESAGGNGGEAGFFETTPGERRSCVDLAANCGETGSDDCCSDQTVPGGSFKRSPDSSTVPALATVSSFRLDTYEVTVGRFRRFVSAYSQGMTKPGAGKNSAVAGDPGWSSDWNALLPESKHALVLAVQTNCTTDQYSWTDQARDHETLPINCLSWYEAFAFCIWDGGRLPTDAEWNYAASGGADQRHYPWGDTEPSASGDFANYGCSTDQCVGVRDVAPVGTFPKDKARWGNLDLGGNTFEWALDLFESFDYSTPCLDCARTTMAALGGMSRVVRGAGVGYAPFPTSGQGNFRPPTNRDYKLGARCAHNL